MNLKASIYTMRINKKNLSKVAISPYLAPQHVNKIFPDISSTPVFPNEFPRTNIQLNPHKQTLGKVQNHIRNYFKIELL